MCGCTHAMVCQWRPEDTWKECFLPLCGGRGSAICQACRMQLSGVFNGAEINPMFFRLLGLALIKNFCEYRFLPPALEVVIQEVWCPSRNLWVRSFAVKILLRWRRTPRPPPAASKYWHLWWLPQNSLFLQASCLSQLLFWGLFCLVRLLKFWYTLVTGSAVVP